MNFLSPKTWPNSSLGLPFQFKMAGNVVVGYLQCDALVRNWCKTCENLVHIASTIGELQHTKYLKPAFLDTFK